MRKIISILFIGVVLISCSSDDEVVVPKQDRGTIEMEYKGEKLSFGKKSYNGWLANVENDTLGYFYTARIDVEDLVFHDIRLDVYLTPEREVEKLEMKFSPMENGSAWTYQYSLEEDPLVFKNIEFDGTWLKADFEGHLHYAPAFEDKEGVHLTNGKINVPIKGLDIDWSQW